LNPPIQAWERHKWRAAEPDLTHPGSKLIRRGRREETIAEAIRQDPRLLHEVPPEPVPKERISARNRERWTDPDYRLRAEAGRKGGLATKARRELQAV
jgi:hypothetical protein